MGKAFSNRSNAKRAIGQFRDKHPNAERGVEFAVVNIENGAAKLVATVFDSVNQDERDAIAKIADIAAPTAGRAILTEVVAEAIANGSPVIEEVPAMPEPLPAPSEVALPTEAMVKAAKAEDAEAKKAARKAEREARKAAAAESRKEVARVKEEAQKERAKDRAAKKAE